MTPSAARRGAHRHVEVTQGDTDAQTGAAYLLYMANGPTKISDPQNVRYPDITADTFDDVPATR